MQTSLTKGPVTRSLLRFAAPMIAGNLLQQVYNVADTLIVGRFLGPDALAAVGASYAVMVFLTSVVLGLCMGSGMLFSMQYGAGDTAAMKHSMVLSFGFIGAAALLIEGLALALIDPFLRLLQIPEMFSRSPAPTCSSSLSAPFSYSCITISRRCCGRQATRRCRLSSWRCRRCSISASTCCLWW